MKFLFLSFALMICAWVVPAAEEAPIAATYADLHGGLKTALDCFSNDCGRFPTTSEGFEALLICPTNIPVGKWRGPYLDQIPKDVWHHEYVYRCPGTHNTNGYDLYSCGYDGISKSGGDDLDDINNWDPDSPHGGTDHLYFSDELRNDFIGVPVFYVILLVLLIFLGVYTIIASIFSPRIRASIARHPIEYSIYFLASLLAFWRFLSFVMPLAGR